MFMKRVYCLTIQIPKRFSKTAGMLKNHYKRPLCLFRCISQLNMATIVRIFFFMKTVIMFSFSHHLKTCINFQFFNQNYFDLIFKSWIICITYKKNEMIIFLAAWIDVNALIIACPLSIQTVPSLTIYKQNVYNALQTIRIIRHKLCVFLLFYHT